MRFPYFRSRDGLVFPLTPSGNPIKSVRSPVFDGSRLRLEVSSRINIQDSIESYAPFTDLNYMLHRLSLGDSSVLSGHKPIYGDFSRFPSNPVDLLNMVSSAEQQFSELSVDEKKVFHGDWRRYFVSRFLSVPVSSGVSSDGVSIVSFEEVNVNEPQC